MNDLERDLKDLFDAKARAVDTTPAPPEAVMRRGRRRQVGVVLGGALAGIAALAIAGGITMSMLGDGTELVPSGPDGPYGERTAVIEGFEVQAPAGWTLMDQWAMANVLATGTSCSSTFSSVGQEVGGTPSIVEQTAAPVEQTCSTDPLTLPAGVPVLQLSTFDPGLMSPVCDVFDEGTGGALPGDGVAVLVTAFPGTPSPEDVQAALTASCAATPDIGSIVQGSSVTYVTATFAGADADPALLDIAAGFVTDLGDHDTRVAEPSPLSGPAYVIGSGVTGDERWQISAGIALDQGNIAAAWMTSFEEGSGVETGTLMQPWRGVGAPVASALDVSDAAVAIALVPAGFSGPIWVTDAGIQVPIEETPFPGSLSDLTADAFVGSVAWGEVPNTLGHLTTDQQSTP